MRGCTKFLYVIPFLLIHFLISGQNNSLLKNFLTVDNGLSHNEVTSIVQDKDGFIWIGTRGGLNRYDGYEFKVFNQVPGDSNSLVNPSIETLFVDSKGNIWIGTKSGGVSKYNPVTGIFTNIVSNYKKSNSIIPSNRLISFYEDKNGKIWIGTWKNGLVIYDEETKTSQPLLAGDVNSIKESADGRVWVGAGAGALYEIDPSDYSFVQHLKAGTCQEIEYDDKRNAIWIVSGNNSGLRKFDLRNNEISRYRIGSSFAESLNPYHTMESILIDKQDRIWIGTWGTGLYLFDQENETFTRYLVYPENRQTLNKDYDAVLDIFQDKDNNIWLGTNGGGVCVLTPKLKFNSVGYHPETGKGLTNTRLMSVLDDQNGNLWMGTIGSGLFWSPDKENIYQVEYPDDVNNSLFFTIKYLYEDKEGKIWMGTNKGTHWIEFVNGVPQMIQADLIYNNTNLRRQGVSFLDTDEIFFVGSLQAGLFLFEKKNNYKLLKKITKNNQNSGDLRSNRISYLLKDSKKRIWIGTYNGLHIFNNADTTVQLVEKQFNVEGEFTGNIITCISEDQKGSIWIGTPNGLNRLTKLESDKFEVQFFTEKDGLASNFIKGISFDQNGNIWVSTNVGISKLQTKEENRVVNFDVSDGVNGKNFTEASVFKNYKGEIFFGGNFGLTYFNPNEIEESQDTHKPIFTGLKVLNESIHPGTTVESGKILSKSITHTKEIELSYHQNNFEIEFSALNYQGRGRVQYQYKLENHDEDWNFIGKRHFVNFNHLKPGEYILKVKSANSHNVWNNEPAVLEIKIRPPFWQTWYALIFYILAITGIVTIIRWNAIKQVRLANSLEMEKIQHEQDQKMSEMKFRFFTNISHEFRTPLTLILAPLKELINKKEKYEMSDAAANKIGIVQNNSLRLMKLVNQLLDFRKVESGNMKLTAHYTDLEKFVSEICYPFYELAEINNIKFKFKPALKTKNIWLDRDKLEIVLNNLVSNAFKYLKENGKIEIAIFEEEDEVLISVSDSGPGIHPTEIGHIFDRFYRVGQSGNYASSGIGLALAKRFTELQKGSISVTSTPNEHTEFIVSLLKGDEHLKPEEKAEIDNSESSFVRKEPILSGILPGKSKPKIKSEECILIVEDNLDVQNYLKELLEPLYNIKTVSNGSEGIKTAIEIIPDLIISDVMMPVMDGFEFCKRIRSNDLTSTIPFIFLTAKSDDQFKLLGTRIGADDFLSKPFDPEILAEKVNNILTGRKKLQKKLSKSIRLEPSDIEITSTEEIFIEKVLAFIEENLQNPKFNSEMLASELNMSGSSMYRKLKGLTGSSTAEFIRSIRIKRAAQFLKDKQLTITEIAYDVGFNDVKHFRSVFQKQFSCSPSEYREKL